MKITSHRKPKPTPKLSGNTSILRAKQDPDLNINPKDKNSPLTKTDKDKAEILGTFFTSVYTNEPDGEIPTMQQNRLVNEMSELNNTEDNVKKLLRN